MSAFSAARAAVRTAAAGRSGHSGQRRDIGLMVIQLSELRQRPGSSVNRHERVIAAIWVNGRISLIQGSGREPTLRDVRA